MNNFYDNFPMLVPSNVSGMFDLFDEVNSLFAKPIVKKFFPYPTTIYNVIDKKTGKITSTVINVALAGFSKEDISVKAIKGKSLTISVTPPKEEVNSETEIKYLFDGIAQRAATYTWSLSDRVDLTNFKPKFVNGILTVTIPVLKEEETENEVVGIIE